MAISQKITQLPTPPTSTDPVNFRQRADEFVGAFPQLTDEMNVAIDQINATESNINNKEQSATDAATTAMASANFKGEWDSTIQYTHPTSVVKNGIYYVSLQDSIGQNPETTIGYWEVLKDQNNTLHKIGSGLPNEAYTKTEIDSMQFNFKNKIINGDFQVNQRYPSNNLTSYTEKVLFSSNYQHIPSDYIIGGTAAYTTESLVFDGTVSLLRNNVLNENVSNKGIIKFKLYDLLQAQTIWKTGGTVEGIGIGLDGNGNFGIATYAGGNRAEYFCPTSILSTNVWYIMIFAGGGWILIEESTNKVIYKTIQAIQIPSDGSNYECIGGLDCNLSGGNNIDSILTGSKYTSGQNEMFNGEISYIYIFDKNKFSLFLNSTSLDAFSIDRWKTENEYVSFIKNIKNNYMFLIHHSDDYNISNPSFEQRLENPYDLINKNLTLSFNYKTGTQFYFDVVVGYTYGDRGNFYEETIDSASIVNEGRYVKTFNLISDKNIFDFSDNDYFYIKIIIKTSDVIPEFTNFQLEEGEVATIFEKLPYDIQLQRCMRYYEVSDTIIGSYPGTSSNSYANWIFKVEKRVLPSVNIAIDATYPVTIYGIYKTNVPVYYTGYNAIILQGSTADAEL